jgi:FkbM family methyltransferase
MSEPSTRGPEREAAAPPPHIESDRAMLEEVDEYFEVGACVDPGDVVVDVGANVGAFAMRVAERTDGRVTIHCFEPAPITFVTLQQNVASHPELRQAKSTTSCLALTRPDVAGEERAFYYFERIPTNSTYDIDDKRAEYQAFFAGKAAQIDSVLSSRVPLVGSLLGLAVRRTIEAVCHRDNRFGVWLADRATGLRVISCQTQSLERWAEENGVDRIDLLKVDVEGAELDVLLGCGSKWPIIRSVVLEAHDRDGRIESIVALLEENGLTSIRRLRPRVSERSGLDNVILIAHRADDERQKRVSVQA